MVNNGVYKNILVGVDGSKNSYIAFTEAVNIGIRNNAQVNVIQVINDTHTILTNDSIIYLESLAEEEFTLLSDIARNLGYTGKLISHVVLGSPKHLLGMTLPKKLAVDLVVVGQVGKHFIKGSLLGSVTSYIVKNAPCNILVCK